jgi:hypothetical protein
MGVGRDGGRVLRGSGCCNVKREIKNCFEKKNYCGGLRVLIDRESMPLPIEFHI